jgi:hypothetical protein
MAASLGGYFNLQSFTDLGALGVGMRVYTYATGTTTHKTAYTDAAGAVAHTYTSDGSGGQYIACNARGELPAPLFLTSGAYDILLKTSAGVSVWTRRSTGTDDAAATLAADLADTVSAAKGSALVGYSSALSYPADTVGAKLREWVSVKDYGAVGDGIADDTAAIQAALDSNSYAHVLLPTGTYRVTATLSITKQNTLTGPDGGSQEMQHAVIYHDPASSGVLFNVTTAVSGVCLKNFRVTGGNGSFCITSSNSYVRYEYIYMQAYNGSGIQLLTSGVGSSSSKLLYCEWVGPATPTAYTGFEINVSGGDVWMHGCTAIRGAIGINVIQGQTIIMDGVSVNKQAITYGFSSASQFNTCGIRLTGAYYKQAISIRNSYVEACTNSIYVESCESLTIQDTLIDDGGVSGFDGNGNSAITLTGSNCKNVTIMNNNVIAGSNGTVPNPYYIIRTNDASNVLAVNNHIEHSGANSGVFYTISPTIQFKFRNTIVVSTGSPVADYEPNGALSEVLGGQPTSWVSATLNAPWTDATSEVQYRRDGLGNVLLKGSADGGSSGTVIFTLPVGFRPAYQQSFPVNATAAFGVVLVGTNGDVTFSSGTGTYVYLSGTSIALQ